VLAVIPCREGFHPSLGVSLGGKTLRRPVWTVFAGSEQGLGEGVVVAHARAAVGRGDALCPALQRATYAA
jgi:hypothetical protein